MWRYFAAEHGDGGEEVVGDVHRVQHTLPAYHYVISLMPKSIL